MDIGNRRIEGIGGKYGQQWWIRRVHAMGGLPEVDESLEGYQSRCDRDRDWILEHESGLSEDANIEVTGIGMHRIAALLYRKEEKMGEALECEHYALYLTHRAHERFGVDYPVDV